MLNLSKGLVVANFVLAMLFLGGSVMVRASHRDLDKALKDAESEVRVFDGKLADHKDTTKPGREKDFRDLQLALQAQGNSVKEFEKKTLDKRTDVADRHGELIKAHDANIDTAAVKLADQLKKLKETREAVEKRAVERDQKKREIEKATEAKTEFVNRKFQSENTLETVEARNVELKGRLDVVAKLLATQ